MIKVIKPEIARFRIQIYDLKEKKSRTISVADPGKFSVEELKKKVIECLENFK